VDRKFNIIIDDGLHAPNANIATLIFACENLKENGWFVVEDIQRPKLPIWQVVSHLLADDYVSYIVAAKSGFLFVVRRRSARSSDITRLGFKPE
jgi:hypothetical protein